MSRPSKASASRLHIRQVSWADAQHELIAIRTQVFIHEQRVPEALEWDGLDDTATHLLALADSAPAGCARMLADGHLGRMAVLPTYRGLGIGKALLEAAIAYGRSRAWPCIKLSAQKHAIGFYTRAGFVVCSAEYEDAGIPHHDMQLLLSD